MKDHRAILDIEQRLMFNRQSYSLSLCAYTLAESQVLLLDPRRAYILTVIIRIHRRARTRPSIVAHANNALFQYYDLQDSHSPYFSFSFNNICVIQSPSVGGSSQSFVQISFYFPL